MSKKTTNQKSPYFRFNAKITHEARHLLQDEQQYIADKEACRVPYGRIINDLILKHLSRRRSAENTAPIVPTSRKPKQLATA